MTELLPAVDVVRSGLHITIKDLIEVLHKANQLELAKALSNWREEIGG